MIKSLIGPVSSLLDKFIEDKDQKNSLAHEIATMSERHAQELAKGQLEVNKVEAASTSLFVSGWRPAVGWVCVFGFAGNFITILSSEVRLPLIPMAEMMPVLLGMLGLGAMRSVEKVQQVARDK